MVCLPELSGPASSFQSAGPIHLFEVKFGGVLDFKNGLPGADSIFFNTVTNHQSFFFNSLTNEEGVSNRKV